MSSRHSQQKEVIEPAGFEPLGDVIEARADSKHTRRRIILYAVLAVFGGALLFLFTARSVHLEVVAENPHDLSLKGFALRLGDRYLLYPGSYQVSVRAPGYMALETSIDVSDQPSQIFQLSLQPLPGKLSIISDPPAATVLLNGESVGTTPLQNVELAAGVYQLQLDHERYLPLTSEVVITGRDIRQQLTLTLLPAWAPVTLTSDPEGAEILLGDTVLDRTPATVELMEGAQTLTLSLPQYSSADIPLAVEAGKALDLGEIELQPAPGNLQLVSTPSGANVTLDGSFAGRTPLMLDLTPGQQHQISLQKPGYQRHQEVLALTAGSQEEHNVTLKPQLGTVHFSIRPAAATLYVGGKRYSGGDRTLSLATIDHSVEIRLEGYATETLRVTPRAGLEQRVDITLKTEKEALMARLPATMKNSLGQSLVLINPTETPTGGRFTMGASRRDPGRRSNEILREVSLQRLFYLQTTEVTNAQFRQFQSDHKSGQIEGRSLNREQQPAVELSWQQAASFCNWLSRKEGLPPFYREERGIIVGFNPDAIGYRLPTEAEWAFTARIDGNDQRKFPWGETFPPTEIVENYADSSSAFITGRVLNNYVDQHVVSAPVASYTANHSGLYDIGGNVAEWIHDVYEIPDSGGPVQTDPVGKQSGDNYVIRGASWSMARLPQLRLSYRDYGQAGRDDVGFRIARYAE